MLFSISFTFEDGRQVEGLLLAVDGDRIRFAPRSGGDTIELTRIGDRWQDELGREITIDAVIAMETRGRSMSAGMAS